MLILKQQRRLSFLINYKKNAVKPTVIRKTKTRIRSNILLRVFVIKNLQAKKFLDLLYFAMQAFQCFASTSFQISFDSINKKFLESVSPKQREQIEIFK